MEHYGYIYLTENKKNGKVYIGQNKGYFNPSYFGSGKILKNAIRKEGKNCFTIKILLVVNTKEDLDNYEIKVINFYRKLGRDLYNLADGGQNQPYLFQTGRTRFRKGQIPWNKGLHLCLNTGRTHLKKGQTIGHKFEKGKRSAFFGRKHTPEAIEKMKKTWFKVGVSPTKEIIMKRNLTNAIRLKNLCAKKS